ncbi:MAG TPA: protein meaA, partial [Acidimicrobiaceae bacterium]|nr:protein meaA [Acidimicrobiaceae bacterium]
WDQQWSLRIQQVLALETDLLEYDDIFDGSHVVENRTADLIREAQLELAEVMELGGAFIAIDELKQRLVASHTDRMRQIESAELTIVG